MSVTRYNYCSDYVSKRMIVAPGRMEHPQSAMKGLKQCDSNEPARGEDLCEQIVLRVKACEAEQTWTKSVNKAMWNHYAW